MEKCRDSQVLGWQLCSRRFSKTKATSYYSASLSVCPVSSGSKMAVRAFPIVSVFQEVEWSIIGKRKEGKSVQQLSLKEGSSSCHMTLTLTFTWPEHGLVSTRKCAFLHSTWMLSLNISQHGDLCNQYQKVSVDTNLVL